MHRRDSKPVRCSQFFRYRFEGFCNRGLSDRYHDLWQAAPSPIIANTNLSDQHNHPPPREEGDHYGQRTYLKDRHPITALFVTAEFFT